MDKLIGWNKIGNNLYNGIKQIGFCLDVYDEEECQTCPASENCKKMLKEEEEVV